jgi:tripartite ATP-independent transporter DctM subunit
MELIFLCLLILLMAGALASGFPVAFALPGSAILTIGAAAGAGQLFAGDPAAFFAQGGPVNWLTAGVTNFRGVYWEVERDTLIAIPLFVFMGIMLQRSKIAEDLLVSMAQLFGPIRGGLGISVVFVGALLAATTGIVGATVVAMGLISLPAMLRNNYSHSLATGTIAASGTLGQIIPPSIVLIILADQLSSAVDQAGVTRKAYFKETTGSFSLPSEFGVASTSAGDMFMGALVPGLVLVALYMLYILVVSYVRPKMAPSVPFTGKYDGGFAVRVLLSLVPPLTLIFVVLGSIITGIATVNQAGAIGAVGALVMAGYRLFDGKRGAFYPATLTILSLVAIIVLSRMHTINIKNVQTGTDVAFVAMAVLAVLAFLAGVVWSGWRTWKVDNTLYGVMVETAKTTSLVFIILLGAAMLTAAFRAFGGEDLVREFLTGLPGGFWTQFIIVMAVIFVLGFFLDFIEIAVVVVPIVAPILLMDPSANITAVWLGVMIGLNIQTSFLTPPFGFALFYLRGVAPAAVRTISMYRGVVPFILLQLTALVIVGTFPALVNYLPNRISLTAQTAPPPKNPKLQACIEEHIAGVFATDGPAVRAEIARARGWDLGYLPANLRKDVTASFDKAEQTFDLLRASLDATAAIAKAAETYGGLHRDVRAIQASIANIEADIREFQGDVGQLSRAEGDHAARIDARKRRIAELTEEKAALAKQVPANWDADHKAFAKLLGEEKKAQLAYRRAADQGYDAILELSKTIAGAEALRTMAADIRALPALVAKDPSAATADAIAELERVLGSIADSNDIRSPLSKARRELKSKTPKPEAAVADATAAVEAFEAALAWRGQASESLLADVRRYEEKIRRTIGLRQQERLPRDIALEVAACSSHHNDISLYF